VLPGLWMSEHVCVNGWMTYGEGEVLHLFGRERHRDKVAAASEEMFFFRGKGCDQREERKIVVCTSEL
jgi:hypothetical protein